jgi:hypothetical protein
VLVDTSTLLCTLQPLHPQRETARAAIKALTAQGHKIHIVPQNLVELWVVATRPIEQNGLGMTPAAVVVELTRLKDMFALLPEIPAIYPIWEVLVFSIRCPANRPMMPGLSPPCGARPHRYSHLRAAATGRTGTRFPCSRYWREQSSVTGAKSFAGRQRGGFGTKPWQMG